MRNFRRPFCPQKGLPVLTLFYLLIMDREFIQEFITAALQSPPRYLFLLDSSGLIRDLSELNVADQIFKVVYFENDLQLRSELEWTKSDGFDLNFCIISTKNDAENRTIQDFISRATVLKITPQILLNFASNDHWSPAANWLTGSDFWRCLDSLKRVKQRSDLTLADPDEIYLASALLGVNLTRRFDPASGFIFFFGKMYSAVFQTFRANYPQLTRRVEEKLFAEVPELREFQDQPALISDLWAGNYASLPARLTDAAETEDLKYQMAIKAPILVQDQIEAYESGHLRDRTQIQTYFATRASDNWQGWVDYLHREKMLVAPVKLVLQKIIHYLFRTQSFDLEALQSAISSLEQHQALRRREQSAESPLAPYYGFVQDLLALWQRIQQLQANLVDNSVTVPEMIQSVYPQLLSPLWRNLDDLENRHLHLKFIEDAALKKLAEKISQLQAEYHAHFVQWIVTHWQHPPENLAARLGLAPYPFQIIKAHLAEKNPRPLVIMLFDGMHWDGWEWLKPHFTAIFPGTMTVAPLLTPLPGITRISRPYLLSGVPAGMDEWETLRRQFPGETIEIAFYEDKPDRLRECQLLAQSTAAIKVMLINLFDRRIHHSRLGPNLLSREIETEFRENLVPILAQLPKDAKIIITSDHGFLQVTGKWLPDLSAEIPAAEEAGHRRFALLPPHLANRQHFIFMENEKLGESADSSRGFAFLRDARILKTQPNESYPRYAHGGISLPEMIVPLVIYN